MMNYPNGKVYRAPMRKNVEKRPKTSVSHAKRGMALEEQISESNQYYLQKGIAVIHKKPTPIQVVKVDYPKRSAAVIKEAYYRHSSTTDFNGIYQGKYLDFEAKETQNKQSFPLKNFHEHQINHMEQCRQLGGITFVLIRFSVLDRVFLLESSHLSLFWENQKQADKRKSIPLTYIEEHGYEITYGFRPTLDYLKVIDIIINEQNI
ncbi:MULTISPECIES: Holliday junction resolvase RecU [unclassified Jeotgalibaca]|uniref:Holliday junction resolvase RecU n=1 Tax=unclassified Jeotgalibaca TaxID=2621505 RepID=UPI003FD37582